MWPEALSESHARALAAISGSPPLPELFRTQAEQATPQTESPGEPPKTRIQQLALEHDDYQKPTKVPRLEAQLTAKPNQDNGGRPTPRRLHFNTELDNGP